MIPVQVLIVEDDPMTRALFEIFIKESGRYAVAGSIESASMAELFCLTRRVDLIIMDVCTALHVWLACSRKNQKNVSKNQNCNCDESAGV